MGVQVIPNQPINLEPYSPDECNLGDGKQYCQLYKTGDTIYLQWKLSPCGDDLVCDPNLNGLLSGNNLLTNGTFTGNADGWTLESFVYGSNKVTANTSNSWANIYQDITGLFVDGASYSFTYTVSGSSHTALTAKIGYGLTTSIPATNGTHTVTLPCTTYGSSTVRFLISANQTTAGSGVNITIDSLSITSIANNTCITYNSGYYGNGWDAGPESLCHTPGTGDHISVNIPLVDNTDYQQIIIQIDNYVSGSVIAFVNGVQLDWPIDYVNQSYLSANGIFKAYSSATTTITLEIVASSDFEGCITGISCYELNKNYTIALTDMDGVIVDDLSAHVIYGHDVAYMSYDSSVYPDGCYKIAVLDSCASFSVSGEVNTDSSFASTSGWTLAAQTVGTIQITGGQLVTTASNSGSFPEYFTALRQGSFNNGDTLYAYAITVSTGVIDDPSASGISIRFPSSNGSSYQQITIEDQLFSNATYTKTGIVNISNGTSGTWFNTFQFVVEDRSGTNLNVTRINSVSVILSTIPDPDNSYISNCFSVNTSHECAKLIEGTSERATDNYLGFVFGTGLLFRISARARVLKVNPSYPIDATDSEYSDGSRHINGGKREKYYEILLDHIDETTHDWISAAILCDYFTIDGVRYYVKPDDYKPEWSKEGTQQVAQVRILARKRTSTIYKING